MLKLPLALSLALPLALSLAAPAVRADDAAGDGANAYTIEAPKNAIKVKKGNSGIARLAVVPKPGAHVSPDAPISLSVTGGAALDLPKAKLGRAEAALVRDTPKDGVAFEIPFSGKSAGTDALKANLTFYICTEKLCERQKQELTLAVLVEE